MLLSRLPLETCDVGAMLGTRMAGCDAPSERLHVHGWLAALLLLELAGVIGGTHAMRLGGAASATLGSLRGWAGIAGAVALWLLAARSQKLYDEASMLSDRAVLPRAAWAATATFGIVLLVAIAGQAEGAATVAWQTECAAAAGTWMLVVRGIWSACLKAAVREGRCVERALVVAETPLAARYAAVHIERSTLGRIHVAASTAVSTASAHQAMGVAHGFCSIDVIEAEVRAGRFDRVLIVEMGDGGVLLSAASAALVKRLARLATDVTVVPGTRALALWPRSARQLGGLAGIDLVSRPLLRGTSALKRVEDVLVAGLVLLAASPAMLLAAALIRLESPGPVLFSQRRVGLHGQVFRVWKFRTMYAHLTDADAAVQTTRHDKRVTRVGRLLRRTSLDELPQVFNVLVGDMSIVGPRPHAVGMTVAGHQLHDLIDAYSARHRIKPGITGWAQVNGCRGEVDTEQKLLRRLSLDCHYIANWSLALDSYVIARTAAMLVFDRQAY